MRIAVIGGSGFASGFGEPAWERIDTPYGEAVVSRTKLESGRELLFLPRHGPGHRVPPHLINHRANIEALRGQDVRAVIATAAVGALRREYAPGDCLVLDDFIDLTRGPVTTFYDRIGDVRHTDFSVPFDPGVRQALIETFQSENSALHTRGTYLCLSGPRYETPAEVRLFASWGADVVGMTVAPEAVLAREADLAYAAIAISTNYGCGLVDTLPLSHSEVEHRMALARDIVLQWIVRAADAISETRG